MAEKYTGKERVLAACKGEYLDRIPISMHMPKAHELVGITAKEYLLDAEKALKAELKAHEIFPSDMLMVPGDPFMPTVAEAMFEAKFGPGAAAKPRLEDKARIEELKVRDPRESKVYAKYLEMCRKALATFEGTFVGAEVAAPWSIAVNLRGVEALIYDTVDDPQFVHALMRFCTDLSKARGDAVLETGVDLFYPETSASCSVISPNIYKDFVDSYLRECITHFRSQGAFIDLHICGYTDPILEYTTSLDIDVIDIDALTSLKKAVEISKKKITMRGNLAAELFGEGTPQQIEQTVKECIETAAEGGKYILSPGCTIAYDTPLENLRAFWDAGVKYGPH